MPVLAPDPPAAAPASRLDTAAVRQLGTTSPTTGTSFAALLDVSSPSPDASTASGPAPSAPESTNAPTTPPPRSDSGTPSRPPGDAAVQQSSPTARAGAPASPNAAASEQSANAPAAGPNGTTANPTQGASPQPAQGIAGNIPAAVGNPNTTQTIVDPQPQSSGSAQAAGDPTSAPTGDTTKGDKTKSSDSGDSDQAMAGSAAGGPNLQPDTSALMTVAGPLVVAPPAPPPPPPTPSPNPVSASAVGAIALSAQGVAQALPLLNPAVQLASAANRNGATSATSPSSNPVDPATSTQPDGSLPTVAADDPNASPSTTNIADTTAPDATGNPSPGSADVTSTRTLGAMLIQTPPGSDRLDTAGPVAAKPGSTPAQISNTAIGAALSMPALWAQAPSTPAPDGETTVPVAGLAIEIAARASNGEKSFQIRLDPPELGRVDVELNVDGSGRVSSHLTVDRPETLALLRQEAPSLERALQSAGLSTDGSGLQFSLRDQSFAGGGQSPPPTTVARIVIPQPDLPPVEAAARGYARLSGLGSGVDIRV